MASVLDICNTALVHLGSDAIVSSINPPDGTVEAGYCKRFYPLARRTLLVSFPWAFARKRAQLALLATNPSAAWLYAYALPSDLLAIRKVLFSGVPDNPERDGAPYEIEGQVLLTNQPQATLIYTVDIEDTTKFPADFVSALGMMLAGYLAGPLIKGAEGMRVGDAWSQKAMESARSAIAREASGSAHLTWVDAYPPSIAARQ